MKKYLILTISLFCIYQLQAGILKGRITDETGNALPFANIVIQGTSIGTNSNTDGYYQLELANGNHTIVFQYIGYKKVIKQVTIQGGEETLNITLKPETFSLGEIEVNAGDEDPAYAIIRKAQDKRKFYLKEEYKNYECKVYTKIFKQGTQEGGKIQLFGTENEITKGIFYLSEAISELQFEQTNKYKEKIVASLISGDTAGYTYNRAGWLNFYRNQCLEVNRVPIASPIANNAMQYYKYKLEGASYEGDILVNKIKIEPKSSAVFALEGYIYVMEDSWRIHSVDVVLKDMLSFEKIEIKQIYTALAKEKIWMPFSLNFYFTLTENKAFGYYHSITSDYKINTTQITDKSEVLSFDENSNQKDNIFWDKNRPIPLTPEEIKDYQSKNKILKIEKTEVYQDSVLKKENKTNAWKVIFEGYEYENKFKKKKIRFPNILEIVNFNTVEGLVIDAPIVYTKELSKGRRFIGQSNLRYGFSNTRPQGRLVLNYLHNPKNFASWQLEGGRYIEQLSRFESITPWWNTYYTLLNEENFMKIYEKSYVKLNYEIEPLNGIRLFASAEYANRNAMENTTDYTWTNVENREFNSNAPFNQEIAENIGDNLPIALEDNEGIFIDAGLRISFKQKYINRPEKKQILPSKLPSLTFRYRKGLQDVDFDFVSARVNDVWVLGNLGVSKIEMEGGMFLNDEQMTFVDFHHFAGNQTELRKNASFGDFQLLEYYRFSTQKEYFRGHFEHNFRGFIVNKLPLLKHLKTQTILNFNYLNTESLGNYMEFGVGFGNILNVFRLDWYNSWQDGEHIRQGFRFGLNF